MDTATATIGDNSIPARDLIKEDPGAVYRDGDLLDRFVKEAEKELATAKVDLSTTAGRDEIKSRAAEFSRLKTPIETAGKALTEGWRLETAKVNAVKSAAVTAFDTLRDKARKPLTEWEAAKEKRDAEIMASIEKIETYGIIAAGATAAALRARVDELNALVITEETHGSFELIANGKRALAIGSLNGAIARAEQHEADQIELARLRAEQDRRDREEKVRADQAAAEQAERDRIAANDARVAADAKRLAQGAIDDANRRAQEAEDKARRQREEAAAEQKRIAAAEAERVAAEEARAANQRHRSKIMGAAKKALMDHTGANEEHAKCIVLAIVAGSIPNIMIKF